jgi:AcrR family transcriptional regulator
VVTNIASLSTTNTTTEAKERILNAAYELFSQHGIGAVGVDTIIAKAGVAKMTLYRHFKSKEKLVLAFLARREARWTHEWLETEILAAANTPTDRLLAIFDTFDRWFQEPDFEGCSFINVLLEAEQARHALARQHEPQARDGAHERRREPQARGGALAPGIECQPVGRRSVHRGDSIDASAGRRKARFIDPSNRGRARS